MTKEELKQKPLKGLINVAQLLQEPVGACRSYDISEVMDEQAGGCVKGKITLIRSGQGILVQAELTVEIELTCSRCLDIFLFPMRFDIEEEFLSTVDISSGLPLPLSEESAGFTIDNDHLLDLGELIRQYALLNLPMKPLCRPDCAGIRR
jgi:uncharacterized protein